MASLHKQFALLAPAPPKPKADPEQQTTFYDLPAELRIEIYKLALLRVTIHILPPKTADDRKSPHALTRTSKQVRNEVLPLIHTTCPITCSVTDFNFDGILEWMSRVPPNEERNLTKNKDLRIEFHTSQLPQREHHTLRRWLHMRADKFRPQPQWKYTGQVPTNKVCADLRRRAKRMKEYGKQKEMLAMLTALQVTSLPELMAPPTAREAGNAPDGTTNPDGRAESEPFDGR